MKNKRTVYPSFLFASILKGLINVLRAFRVEVVYLPSPPPLVHFLKELIRKWELKIDPVPFSSKKLFKELLFTKILWRTKFSSIKNNKNGSWNCIKCKKSVLRRAFWRIFSLFRGLSITRKPYKGKGLSLFCYITLCFGKSPIFRTQDKKQGLRSAYLDLF